jgi:hypothetical protein
MSTFIVMIKSKLNLLFLTIFTACFTKAQVTFVPGYMIDAKGDTLKGEVKTNPNPKKEADNFTKVFFKDANGVQKNWKPAKVKGYGFAGKHFVTITEKDESMFYQRLTNGPIILYKSAFEAVSATETTKEIYFCLWKEGDKKVTEVKETKFKKQIQEWMSGNAGFANDYEDGKTFNEAAAVDVINKYNDWKKSN